MSAFLLILTVGFVHFAACPGLVEKAKKPRPPGGFLARILVTRHILAHFYFYRCHHISRFVAPFAHAVT